MFKTEQEAVQALQSTLSELDALTKSWSKDAGLAKSEKDEDDKMEKAADLSKESLYKAEGDEEAASEQAPLDAAPAPAPETGHGEPDGDEGAPPAEGEMPVEAQGGEGQDDNMMAEAAAAAQQLSDEELDMLLHTLMEEKDHRMAGPEGEPAGAPAPEAAAAPAEPEEKSLAMSMKEEFSKMAKSFHSEINSLKKSVDALKTENANLRKTAVKPVAKTVTKPAAANKVEVLEKSVKEPERMNKSETAKYLLGEMRKGNKNIKADHVALIGAVRTDDDLIMALGMLKEQGVEIPAKK